jgi:hypothetical protein
MQEILLELFSCRKNLLAAVVEIRTRGSERTKKAEKELERYSRFSFGVKIRPAKVN